jgi:hypothetical protein
MPDISAALDDAVPDRDEPLRRENLTGDRLTGELAVDPLAGGGVKDDHLREQIREEDSEERVESAGIAEIGVSAAQNEAVARVGVGVLAAKVGYKKSSRSRWHSSQHQGFRSEQWWEARAALVLKEKEAQKERRSRAMEINWMGRGKRGAEDAKENGEASGGGAGERSKSIGAGGGDTR